jgi:hypothetical protein
MQRATETESQTALMGTSCLFTLCHTEEKEHGAVSRERVRHPDRNNSDKISEWVTLVSLPAAADDSNQNPERSRVGHHLELLVTELMPQK